VLLLFLHYGIVLDACPNHKSYWKVQEQFGELGTIAAPNHQAFIAPSTLFR